MSVTEILTELPKLTPTDLRTVRRKLLGIAEENDEVSACDAAALEDAQTLDRLEAARAWVCARPLQCSCPLLTRTSCS